MDNCSFNIWILSLGVIVVTYNCHMVLEVDKEIGSAILSWWHCRFLIYLNITYLLVKSCRKLRSLFGILLLMHVSLLKDQQLTMQVFWTHRRANRGTTKQYMYLMVVWESLECDWILVVMHVSLLKNKR